MGYIISHFGYLLIIAVVVAVLGVATAFFADKSAATKTPKGEEDRDSDGIIGCGFHCSSCMQADTCHKEGKKHVLKKGSA